MTKEAVFQLVYQSKSTVNDLDFELTKILNTARMKNKANSISGLLVVRNHCFLQLLEGEEANVRKILARIEADVRHKELKILYEGTSVGRMFPTWSMGLIDESKVDPADHSLYEDINKIAQTSRKTPQLILSILKAFSQKNHAS